MLSVELVKSTSSARYLETVATIEDKVIHVNGNSPGVALPWGWLGPMGSQPLYTRPGLHSYRPGGGASCCIRPPQGALACPNRAGAGSVRTAVPACRRPELGHSYLFCLSFV